MMNAIKKILIGFFLIIGLPITSLALFQIIDSNTAQDDREGAIAAFFILGLPPTGIATYLILDLKHNKRNNVDKNKIDKEQIFLQILAENEGEITVLKFALQAQLPVEKAKEYLDNKAQELDGDFSVNDQAGIVYKFYI
ncbi:hypothetical protein A5482_000415 [Cyanobacterium sp. IPPAS B-1200]|uniref:hypothetical protein n=1 Tax=Cyanobacterium sp. IPPAS B-1200 TaxID=1562720 RepID=UPI0008527953|nr:hypothetical protein [Cyanobacterium sp. IPPAS B-1200]OEJ79457.1 hypothetical protein A5482_00960 [Cyanobacterium sp. IPPAS B-1200]